MGADVHPAVGRVDPDPMDMAQACGRLPRGFSTITGLSRLPQQQRPDNEQHERGYRQPAAAAGPTASNGSCRAVAGGGLMHNLRSFWGGPPRQLLYRLVRRLREAARGRHEGCSPKLMVVLLARLR